MNQNNSKNDVPCNDVRSLEQRLKDIQPSPVRFDAETIFDAVAGSSESVVRSSNAGRRNRFLLPTASACGFAAGVLVTFVFLSHNSESATTDQESAVFVREHLVHKDSNIKPLLPATSLDLEIHVPLTAGNIRSRLSLSESEPAMPFQSSEHAIVLMDGGTLASNATPNVEQMIKELLGLRR